MKLTIETGERREGRRRWWRRGHAAPSTPSVTISGGYNGSLGHIPLVPSLGRAQSATFRAVYLTNPWVYSAVTKIARDLARIPMHVYRLDGNAQKERVRGDVPGSGSDPGATLDRLISQPAGRVSRQSRWEATLKDMLVYGPALWEIEKAGISGATVTGLRHVPWVDVNPRMLLQSGEVERYDIGGLGQRTIDPEDVIHFGYGADPEEPAGVSPLLSCRHTLALHNAVIRHLLAYFGNSARPSGVIEVENLTKEKFENLREMVEQMLTSPENAGRILFTSGSWKATSDTPDHQQVVELIRESRLEVATTYGVPPPTLGILEDTNKATTSELREQYIRDTLGAWAAACEADLQTQLLRRPEWEGLFVEFQLAEQLRPDLEARSKVYAESSDWMTPNEKRSKENMPPLDTPGADEPWVDSGAMPLSVAVANAGTEPEPVGQRNGHRHDVQLEEIT